MEVIDIIHIEYVKILESKNEIKSMINGANINEQFEFGYYTVDGSGSAIIKDTIRITSPIKGRVNNNLVKSSSCKNPVVIVSENGEFHLEFCNISNVRIADGKKINSQEMIGKSLPGDDVVVSLYNRKGKKVEIDSDSAMELVFGKDYLKEKLKNKKNKQYSQEYKKDSQELPTGEPLISSLFELPFKALAYPFKNKYDKSGKLVQKRYGSPTDKRPVDPWILQALKDPFGKKRKKKEEEGNLYENLKEEINRIKQLIR